MNKTQIIKKLNSKYDDLLKDDFSSLAYMFLKDIKNNYQLYDIEIYPRVYPYLEKKTTIENVTFKKIRCDEEKISFYIFNINRNTYIESNYDDTIITYKEDNIFEVKYGSQTDLLNLSNNTYIMNNVIYNCNEIY